ncbi:Ig-like domain-containing protein [Archangium sp.]|uniref:Ig-like domain-containing protein n=1 Tax=Archangium sp. TaxID=1872627 RepID=UPI002D361F63|nr:Ig-like domain-containing protein [Archangium sp.]HYO59751.1 Ig-like domain-containing protein [Archangium sp.]
MSARWGGRGSMGLLAGLCMLAGPGCQTSADPGVHEATEVVERLRAYRLQVKGGRRAVLPPAGEVRVERVEEGLTPGDSRRPARVVLPEVAQRPFRVKDATSGLALEVALEGASPVKAEVVDGYVVYANALPAGGDIVHCFTPEGTEDYLSFEQAPAAPHVHYGLRLGEGVAGLRLVSDTLEVLDASGAPRLRMSPPYLVGADGRVTQADVSVEGCAVDASPAAPWGRRLVAPGSRQCRVRVAWSAGEVKYPAVMDPVWSTTGSLAVARKSFTTTLLQDGRVLAVGGDNESGVMLASTELYDPATGTWATTGALLEGRQRHTATLLGSGKVLVAGGQSDPMTYSSTQTAELYDPATGAWSSAGSLNVSRGEHTASRLSDGRVLVAGGLGSASNIELAEAELYDPATDTWALTGSLSSPRTAHGAVVLADGKVLVFGGGYSPLSAELYDPATGAWTLHGALSRSYYRPAGVLLDDGRILVAGSGTETELYDPATGISSPTGTLSYYRYELTASRLPDGRVVVLGDEYNTYASTPEVYDPATGAWSPFVMLQTRRRQHSACVLRDGRVLVAGGMATDHSYATLASVEVLLLDRGDETAPTVTLTSPAEGATLEGDIVLTATASDDYSVRRVDFYDGDTLIGTATSAPYSVFWYTRWNASNGPHVLTARAYDTSGNEGTSAPISITLNNDVTAPAVTLTSPAAGGSPQGLVTLSAEATDDRGVTSVEFWDGRRLLGTDTEPPYSMTWNLGNEPGGPHTLYAKAYDLLGNGGTSPGVAITVDQPWTAAYDSTLGVPRCSIVGPTCDSGSYLNGRADLEPELNQPNTLYGSCADGTGGYHWNPSIDRIRLSTSDGSPLAPGKRVNITVTVFSAINASQQKLDLYHAANANSPVWTYLTTLTPAGGNTQTLSTSYVLPSGSLQALRGRFRYGGYAAPCGTGLYGYDDHDDLVFAVSSP